MTAELMRMKLFRGSSWRMPRRVTPLLLITFVAAVVGGTAAWWGFPPVALATAQNCNTHAQEFYTQATNNAGLQFVDNGVKAGGAVGSGTGNLVYGAPGTTCVRVASVIDVNLGGGEFVEVGWHTQNGVLPSWVEQCGTSVDPAHPMVFYNFRIAGAQTDNCTQVGTSSTLNAGSYYPMSVRSLNGIGDGQTWQIIFNGNTYDTPTPDIGFGFGAGVTNAERHFVDSSDPTQEPKDAHFTGMKYWAVSPPTSGAWTAWGSLKCFWGPDSAHGAYEDPVYYNWFPSDTTEVVVQDGPTTFQCPNPPPM